MAITIKWKAIAGASKIRLYQCVTKFTHTDIGVNGNITMVELPGTAVERDVGFTRNTVNYFLLSAIDAAGVTTYGACFPVGNYPDSGPGPQTPVRGDWEFGIFGELTTNEFLHNSEIMAGLAAGGFDTTLFSGAQPINKWTKCIVGGKILFIPDTYFYLLPPNGNKSNILKANGLSFDNDAADALVVIKNGYHFKQRLPLASTRYTAGLLPPDWSLLLNEPHVLGSELGMVMALHRSNGKLSMDVALGNETPNAYEGLCDDSYNPTGQSMYIATSNIDTVTDSTFWRIPVYQATEISAGRVTTQGWYYIGPTNYNSPYALPVFELLL